MWVGGVGGGGLNSLMCLTWGGSGGLEGGGGGKELFTPIIRPAISTCYYFTDI